MTWDKMVAAYAQNYTNERIRDCELLYSNGHYAETLHGAALLLLQIPAGNFPNCSSGFSWRILPTGLQLQPHLSAKRHVIALNEKLSSSLMAAAEHPSSATAQQPSSAAKLKIMLQLGRSSAVQLGSSRATQLGSSRAVQLGSSKAGKHSSNKAVQLGNVHLRHSARAQPRPVMLWKN
ncbi:hypothetical protein SLEP1_g60384 [Rubroshorea leprosula]|uniref:Uncharacterized protein n=1 Tax=Rubroshorea leprosula TaxID=152421 RepID=A0AAV5MV46_9ROSI|nr:hypothetical protein SLEP1_g60384 [Rubroshorea leprosula]